MFPPFGIRIFCSTAIISRWSVVHCNAEYAFIQNGLAGKQVHVTLPAGGTSRSVIWILLQAVD